MVRACVACLKKNEGARDSLYSTGVLPSSHPAVDASAKTRCIARSSASFGFQRSKRKLQNTTTTSLRFFLLPSHVEQSIGSSPEDPTKFKSLRKLTKRQSERLHFSQKLPTDIHYVNLFFFAETVQCHAYYTSPPLRIRVMELALRIVTRYVLIHTCNL